jgi:DNA-binding transcriptional LysR family regulator
MDVSLARTFLEIAASGSFVAAAERLHLTQTAVSARVRVLEEQLGRRLFVRNRAGARLTPAGERFVRHAASLVQVWERARQQVALPPGRESVVSIGAELSLWNPLLADWLVWMRRELPQIALRAEVDVSERLLDRVQDGSLDLAVLYSPPQRPGLVIELLDEEKLVMVTTAADGRAHPDDYILVDWGAAFAANHQAAFPALASPTMSISLGPLALAHVLAAGGSAYLRLSAVRQSLADGRLRRVPDAPEFAYSVYAAYSTRSEADLIDRVRRGLRGCTAGTTAPAIAFGLD